MLRKFILIHRRTIDILMSKNKIRNSSALPAVAVEAQNPLLILEGHQVFQHIDIALGEWEADPKEGVITEFRVQPNPDARIIRVGAALDLKSSDPNPNRMYQVRNQMVASFLIVWAFIFGKRTFTSERWSEDTTESIFFCAFDGTRSKPFQLFHSRIMAFLSSLHSMDRVIIEAKKVATEMVIFVSYTPHPNSEVRDAFWYPASFRGAHARIWAYIDIFLTAGREEGVHPIVTAAVRANEFVAEHHERMESDSPLTEDLLTIEGEVVPFEGFYLRADGEAYKIYGPAQPDHVDISN